MRENRRLFLQYSLEFGDAPAAENPIAPDAAVKFNLNKWQFNMSEQPTQPKASPSMWERSTIFRFFRRLRNRGILRLFTRQRIRPVLIVTAWIVTIFALFYGEEDWRGRSAWNHYREAKEAQGESLDLAAYIPKQVPDDQNFAATPFLQSFMLPAPSPVLTNDFYGRLVNHIKDPTNSSGQRHFKDLAVWQKAWNALQSGPLPREQKFAFWRTPARLPASRRVATAVLEGMKSDEAEFAELRAASTREFSRFPLKYDLVNPWSTLLPHLAEIKQVCQRLNLQACAELVEGQSDQALADVKLSLSLADSIKTEPFLISMLVREASQHIAVQTVWEGRSQHRWNDHHQ